MVQFAHVAVPLFSEAGQQWSHLNYRTNSSDNKQHHFYFNEDDTVHVELVVK